MAENQRQLRGLGHESIKPSTALVPASRRRDSRTSQREKRRLNQELETDYLIIGAGAMGMAFADEVIHGSRHSRVTLIERRAKAGGHWNDAYPFVTLHQPALYYGVNSEKLGSGGGDLASRAEILGYYENVVKKLTQTGRFTFLPLCEYRGEGIVSSTLDPDLRYHVHVRQKTVDATYMNVMVPATKAPEYEVSSDVELVPINALAEIKEPWERYVVIGAGKTGMDAVLYLLERGVDPDRVTWIVSNDSWFLNRKALMPKKLADDMPAQLRCIAESDSLEEVLLRLEAEGRLLRLDPDVWPTKYRCATVVDEELASLRRVQNIVRKGRVLRIDGTSIQLTKGRIPSIPNTLYVDCTADGLAKRPVLPIFEGDRITLQSVSMCQQVFSAALLAAIELRYDDDARKNALCRPVPHPEFPPDLLAAMTTTLSNLESLGAPLALWMRRRRLSMGHHMGWFGFIRFLIRATRWRIDDPARIESMMRAYESAESMRSNPAVVSVGLT
jgi:NAD(P)-binding Rossmann-like domain